VTATSRSWTRPTDIARKVRRRWDDGSLLAGLAAGEPFPAFDLPLRGPRPAEIGEALTEVRKWIAELDSGSRGGHHYQVVRGLVGGRHFGRNDIPVRARVVSYEQAWRVLGVTDQVTAYRRVLELSDELPLVRRWVAEHPLRALQTAGEWATVLAAFRWLDQARGSGKYLREITAPGVDTKFVERHRDLLAALLGVDRGATAFIAGLGLRAKPVTVRLRCDPAVLGLPAPLSEGTFRLDEVAALSPAVRVGVIIENETTYLTVPVPDGGVVIWGKGFEVDRVGALPWLRDAPIHYWGDLDTHGFAILDKLRAWLPHARSFLMDRETLLAHRERWVPEGSPTAARLDRLDPTEADLYDDLVADRLGVAVRLEQERVDWTWARARLPYS
jgi:hypothetical protein